MVSAFAPYCVCLIGDPQPAGLPAAHGCDVQVHGGRQPRGLRSWGQAAHGFGVRALLFPSYLRSTTSRSSGSCFRRTSSRCSSTSWPTILLSSGALFQRSSFIVSVNFVCRRSSFAVLGITAFTWLTVSTFGFRCAQPDLAAHDLVITRLTVATFKLYCAQSNLAAHDLVFNAVHSFDVILLSSGRASF